MFARRALAPLLVLASIALPTHWYVSGGAEALSRTVPTEEVLRLSGALGDASPQVIVLLFVGVVAFLTLVWLAISTAFYALAPTLGRSRRRPSVVRPPSKRAERSAPVVPDTAQLDGGNLDEPATALSGVGRSAA